jgi:outer membrane receptor protein involved in Fe transport
VIYPVSYPPTYNVDNVQLWGLEVAGIYSFSRWLEIEANYAFIQNKKRGDDIVETLYGRDELFNAPEHVLNVFLRARPFEGFLAEWQVNFVSSRFAGGAPGVPPQAAQQVPKFDPITELDAYDLHNIHLSYSPGTWRFLTPRFSFAVQNLFDRRDYIRLDYPLPGRLYYGGIEVDF